MWRKLRISSLYAGGEQMERWHCGYYNIVIFLGNTAHKTLQSLLSH